MHGSWFVRFPMTRTTEDYEGVSVAEDEGDGGMYYPSEMAQYIEEAIHYEGDWGSGRDVEDEGVRKGLRMKKQ